jgi:3-hydroxyisobutyrate dehydrogenase-like beta-hydroxyacid dehydrogenase
VLQGEPSPPRFPVRLAAKDAELILAASELELPALRAAADWLARTADENADYTAVLRTIAP